MIETRHTTLRGKENKTELNVLLFMSNLALETLKILL